MMHKVIFYPVGNGDTSQIVLENGKRLLFDFRHQKQGEESDSPYIDLKKRLTDELKEAQRDYFDVVACLRMATKTTLPTAPNSSSCSTRRSTRETGGSRSKNSGCQPQ